MLPINIKLAFRNLLSHKFFSLLNMLGLALGMSGCLTVILIIRDQLGYDKFHPNAERTYRILSQTYTEDEGGRGKFATTPFVLGETLVRDYAVADKTVRLVRGMFDNDAKTASNLTLPISGYFTEPSFFQVFGFQLAIGNAATALSEPNTLVLSENAAARFFGDQNPVGQVLNINGWGSFVVSGVVAPAAGKSHIGFDCLASITSLAAIEDGYKPADAANKILNNWENRYMSLNYVQLQPGKTKADLEHALADISSKHYPVADPKKEMHFFAQPLSRITPAPELLSNEIGFGLPLFFIGGLAAFALLLIVFPCLNYANLAIARAIGRAKEVGIRKVVGARESDVRGVFVAEAVVIALCALALAWVMHFGFNNYIEQNILGDINLRGSDALSFHADAVSCAVFVIFGLVVGLFAGWLPARRLSKLRPATALRGNLQDKSGPAAKFGWRKAMAVGQFSISLVLMILVATLWSQLRFMSFADYGFQKENLLAFDLKGNKASTLAAEIAQDHRVAGVTASSILIAGNSLQGESIQKERGGEPASIHNIFTDGNYVPVMGLELVAGENFPGNASVEHEQFILLNEKAVASFNLGRPDEALGKTLWLNDSTPLVVQGVLRDFHYRPLNSAIEPFAIRFAPKNTAVLQVRLQPGDPGQALASMAGIWKKADAVHAFEPKFMEDNIANSYKDIEIMGGLIGFFAIMGLSIACLGLLGMVTYTVGTKVKEIGVRKVVGASVVQVVLLLSRNFLLLLFLAVLIALPIGWFISNFFLQFFAYHISMEMSIPGACVLLLLTFGLLAVGVQAVRAAMANPVDSLRRE